MMGVRTNKGTNYNKIIHKNLLGLFEDLYEPANVLTTTSMAESSHNSTSNTAQCQQEDDELAKCCEFIRATCGCTKANGKPCSGHVVVCSVKIITLI